MQLKQSEDLDRLAILQLQSNISCKISYKLS